MNENRKIDIYSAISDLPDSFVEEMLSDDLAADIKARHRRRRITISGAAAAAAAVVIVAVGINGIPHRSLAKSDNAPSVSEGFRAFEDNAEGEQSSIGQQKNAAAGDEAIDKGKETEVEQTEEFAAAEGSDKAEQAADSTAAAENAGEYALPDEETGGGEDTAASDGVESVSGSLCTLSDGSSFLFTGQQVSEEHIANYAGQTANGGIIAYCIDNIPMSAAAALYDIQSGRAELAVNTGYSPETLAELAADLDFKRNLLYDDPDLTAAADRLWISGSEGEDFILTEEAPDESGSSYTAQLGSGELYTAVRITISDSSVTVSTDWKTLCFTKE